MTGHDPGSGAARVKHVPDDGDRAYFRTIEETFIRLRGSPLLLSPSDWQVARTWQRKGIPLDLVCLTLEDVFERRRERGAKGRIQSLRYCSEAVLAAWQDIQELEATGVRAEAPRLDVAARLAALVEHLPRDLKRRDTWERRIRALEGDPQPVEEALSLLDKELIEALEGALSADGRAELEAAVERGLAAVRGRLPEERVDDVRRRLRDQTLRRISSIPVLSLFSPEAREGKS